MSEQYFIRMRGRIQGPFSAEHLQTMARKGQFSRMHEVSRDGITWSRASASPELFPSSQDSSPKSAEPVPPVTTPPQIGPPVAGSSQQGWYYHQFGMTNGPIDFARLQQMADAGQLVGEDMVWKEGMPEWVHAARIPGLIRPAGASGPAPVFSGTSASQPQFGAMSEPPHVSGLAVASLVLGILWLFGIGSLLAVIFGAVALHQIRISKGRLTGTGLAVAGLTLGIVFGALQLLGMVLTQTNLVQ